MSSWQKSGKCNARSLVICCLWKLKKKSISTIIFFVRPNLDKIRKNHEKNTHNEIFKYNFFDKNEFNLLLIVLQCLLYSKINYIQKYLI